MRLLVPFIVACATWGAPIRADVARAIDQVILPAVAAFDTAASDLAVQAQNDCVRDAVLPAYHTTFDAWTQIADLRIGPGEAAALTIAFWPDERGAGARALSALIAAEDPIGLDPASYTQMSAAARGLFALDILLGDAAFAYERGSYTCALVQTITADLSAQADAVREGWIGYAPLLTQPGVDGNLTYLDETEALRALYTQILTSLTVTTDSRIARPLGTFDRPRPTRAEGWRTNRALPNALGYASGAHALATALADNPLPQSDAALVAVEKASVRIADPSFAAVMDPTERLGVEILQQRILALKQAIEVEIGTALGITAGFNVADGD